MDPRIYTGFVRVVCPESNGKPFDVPYTYGIHEGKQYPLSVSICDNGSGDEKCIRCRELVASYLTGGEASDSRFLIASREIK